VRIFKTKTFARFARRGRIADKSLCGAVERAERGLIDGDLGGAVIKQRVARPGEGLRGGYRTLVVYRGGDLAIFLFGFAKKDLDNVEDGDLEDLQTLGRQWLTDEKKIAKDVEAGILIEVTYEGEDQKDQG
jgi:hypothetical protein